MLTKIEKMLGHTKTHLAILSCAFSLCTVAPQIAQAIPFSQISQLYFFGDSLTDSGFNNNITALHGIPFKAPTFTTLGGYTWSQYLARDIKGFTLPSGHFPNPSDMITNNTTPTNPNTVPYVTPNLTGIDYACGGSKSNSIPGFDITWAPSLHQQIQYFLSNAPQNLDPDALYFIWSGANDILAALSPVSLPNQPQLLQIADTATTNIANEVANLSARGARRIVVMSLPNIGSTPHVNALAPNNPALSAEIKNLSFFFDSLLNQKLGNVIKRYRVKILYFDTYTALDNLVAAAKAGVPTVINGESFFFVNYTDPVCGDDSALYCLTGSNNYIFADTVHPTDMAHRALSLEVENRIRAWL